MTQEALKLAIQLRDTASGYWTENEIPIIEKLIELLAQTQKPDYKLLFDELAEKFALLRDEAEMWKKQAISRFDATAPFPPRTWVGLTNDELTDLFYNTNLGQQSAVAQAIALLKERNT